MLCRSPASLTIEKVIFFTKKINTYKLNLNEWFIQLEAYTCYQAKSNYLPNLEPNPSPPHSVDNPPPSSTSFSTFSINHLYLSHPRWQAPSHLMKSSLRCLSCALI